MALRSRGDASRGQRPRRKADSQDGGFFLPGGLPGQFFA